MDISLALGGGGAKGNAHFGVIRCLEREGFKIKAIAGTSSGGLFGAFYAAGYTPDEIIERLKKVDQSKLYGFGKGPALFGTSAIEQLLKDMLGEKRFEDLSLPFAVTAVDLKTCREVVLSKGLLVDALLATIALPGIFPPKQLENYQLVDGGVLDNVPVRVARQLAPKLPVVAVVLTQPMETDMQLSVPVPGVEHNPILREITRLRVAQALNIFMASIDISSRALTELTLQYEQPEGIIRPDVAHIGLLDRIDVDAVVSLGEKAAEAALPDLRFALSPRGRLKRWMRKTLDIWPET